MKKNILILFIISVFVLKVPVKAEFTEAYLSGIAAKYPGDVGIQNDPNVIFTENFEEGTIKALISRWDEAKNSEQMSFTEDISPASSGKNSVLFAHVEGTESGHLYRRLLPGYDQLYLRFYAKFDTECHPISHFLHIGGHNPPTPWAQGGAGTRPSGDDWFTTGVEPFGSAWRSTLRPG